MLIKALLGGLVVIGRDDERGVRAILGGGLREPQRLGRAVRAGAGHDLDASGCGLDEGGNDGVVLLV